MNSNLIETPILVSRIRKSLADFGYPQKKNLILHVSVSNNVREKIFDSKQISFRLMCWSILDDRGEIKPPDFELLSPSVDIFMIKHDFPSYFTDLDFIIIDDDCE